MVSCSFSSVNCWLEGVKGKSEVGVDRSTAGKTMEQNANEPIW